jgi:8-oxo-dGTP pyrophosphatase MutT (NUDIX family)
MRRWHPEQVERLFDHPLLSLDKQIVVSGEERRPVLVLDLPDWVNVIPLTAQGEVLLVRQWRYGLARTTLEIPGGVVEEEESERAAAERELMEETGYRAEHWLRLGEVHPNPAIQTNRTGTWLATGLVRMGEPLGDGQEELELELVPLSAIRGQITSGKITHSLVVAAFYLLESSGAAASFRQQQGS